MRFGVSFYCFTAVCCGSGGVTISCCGSQFPRVLEEAVRQPDLNLRSWPPAVQYWPEELKKHFGEWKGTGRRATEVTGLVEKRLGQLTLTPLFLDKLCQATEEMENRIVEEETCPVLMDQIIDPVYLLPGQYWGDGPSESGNPRYSHRELKRGIILPAEWRHRSDTTLFEKSVAEDLPNPTIEADIRTHPTTCQDARIVPALDAQYDRKVLPKLKELLRVAREYQASGDLARREGLKFRTARNKLLETIENAMVQTRSGYSTNVGNKFKRRGNTVGKGVHLSQRRG